MTIINCDMGEGFCIYRLGDDAALTPLITVANVACGFHASDFNYMRRLVASGRRRHPAGSSPDDRAESIA
jgi:UPF0271 protein